MLLTLNHFSPWEVKVWNLIDKGGDSRKVGSAEATKTRL